MYIDSTPWQAMKGMVLRAIKMLSLIMDTTVCVINIQIFMLAVSMHVFKYIIIMLQVVRIITVTSMYILITS